MKKIKAQGKQFIDQEGRSVILHGINMVCKNKEKGYIGEYSESDFKQLKAWGFNTVRLGIFWDGLEPEAGKYSETYLDQIEEIVCRAQRHDIYVYLDMHQDLFSVLYADGAPEWATLIDEENHVETGLWSESYLLSPAVQRAFDNFWENKPACDGIGIMDHYIQGWCHVAERFRTYDHVVGYDLMNEPFIGHKVEEVLGRLLMAASAVLYPDQEPDLEALQTLWLDPSRKEELMTLLSDRDTYNSLVREAGQPSAHFEATYLSDFYKKTIQAIRQVDPETMMILEANYFSNMGMASGLELGEDTNQVYSPHGYDLLVDTDLYHISSQNRIDTIFDTHNQIHEKLEVPMLIGEWGCFPKANAVQVEQAAYIFSKFEQNQASDTYFDFDHVYGNRILEVIVRSYPMHVSGEIKKYCYDYKTQDFECAYVDNGKEDSIFYLVYNQGKTVVVEPEGNGYQIEMTEDNKGCFLRVKGTQEGQSCPRTIIYR